MTNEKLHALLAAMDTAEMDRCAKRAHIPLQRLISAKAGDLSGWSTAMVEQLLAERGVDPIRFWSDEPSTTVSGVGFLRRAMADMLGGQDLEVLHTALGHAHNLRRLQTLLNETEGFAGDFSRSEAPAERPWRQGYALATHVRKRLRCAGAPLGSVPDLLTRGFGVYVHRTRLKNHRLEAAAIWSAAGAAAILNTAVERREILHRRSLLHELCHILFDPEAEHAILEIEEPTEEGGIETSPREQRARAFAAELLVPQQGLIETLGRPKFMDNPEAAAEDVLRVADRFLAPPELVANHLVNRDYVTAKCREALVERVRDLSIGPVAPQETDSGLAGRVRRCLDSGLISELRAREILGLSVYEPLP